MTADRAEGSLTSTGKLILTGMKFGIPVVMGYVPVGIAYAVSALQAGFSPLETVLMSVLVYSGAGQILGVALTAQHASLIAIAIGTFLINFRYFIMSMCVFERTEGARTPLRALIAFFVTDETFAIFTTCERRLARLAMIAGLIGLTYFSWIAGAVIGVVANALIPPSVTAALGIALYALFIALVMPGCRKSLRITLLVLATALTNTLLCQIIDLSWAVVLSTLIMSALGALFIDPERELSDNPAPADDGRTA